MQLYELMKMLAYNNPEPEPLDLYDVPPYGEKTVRVNVSGKLLKLRDMEMTVTENDIILEVDDGSTQN